MIDQDAIARQVLENCEISYARHAGFHNAKHYAEQIISRHKAGKQKENKDWAQKEIETR